MLAGVLVIAFPVSVFSDLWSEELKEVKGFAEMYENDVDEDEDDDEEDDILQELPGNGSKNGRHVVMEKADLNEIVASLRTIRQEQRQIKRLLKKYYVEG